MPSILNIGDTGNCPSKNHGVLCTHHKLNFTWLWRYCTLPLIKQQVTMCSAKKKYLLEIQLSALHRMGSTQVGVGLTSATGRMAQNRGVFGVKTVHTPLITPNHSSSPFIQLILLVPCVPHFGRPPQGGCCLGKPAAAEQLWIRGGKKELCSLVIIPCRA